MKITLAQEAAAGVAIGATAVLHVDLSATGAPPMATADLLGVTGGGFTRVTLGSGLEIVGGVLDLAGGGVGYVLPAATSKVRGGIVVGTNLTIAGDVLSLAKANVTAALGFTPADAAGLAKVATTGAYADLSGTPANYTLPAATGATLGGVIVGANLTVAAGTISLTKTNAIAALGLTPVDTAGAAAAAPVQSVGGATGNVAVPFAIVVDFSQGVAPQPGTITLDPKLPAACTITGADHAVGTAGGSIGWRLDLVTAGTPTAVTGLSAVTTNSSSVTTTKATGANAGKAGDAVQLVITAVSGTPAGANITIRGTVP